MKYPTVFLFFVVFCFSNHLFGQEIRLKAIVYDQQNKPLSNILVYLLDKEKKTIAYQYTNIDGEVFFNIENFTSPIFFKISSLFFEEKEKNVLFNKSTVFILKPKIEQLDEVVISSNKINRDTLNLNIKKYQIKKNESIEKSLKKIPGISIDKDGRIKYWNKEIEKILIDGDDLADKQYTFISKNLRSEVLDDIQVLNNFEENTVFKRSRKSEKIALNLKIKQKFKNIWFGNVSLGYGDGLGEEEIKATSNVGLLKKKVKFLNALKISSLGEEAIPVFFGNGDEENSPIYSFRKNNVQLPKEVVNFNNAKGNTFLINKKINNLVLRSTSFIGIDDLMQQSVNNTDFFFQNDSFLESNRVNDKNTLFLGEIELKHKGLENSYFVNKLNYKIKENQFNSYSLFNTSDIFDDNITKEMAIYDNFQYTYRFKNGVILNNELDFGLSNLKENTSIISENLNSLLQSNNGKITQTVNKDLKYFNLKTDFSYLISRNLKSNILFNIKNNQEKYNIFLFPEDSQYENNIFFKRNEFIFRPTLIYKLSKKMKFKTNITTSFFKLNKEKRILVNYFASLNVNYWGSLDISFLNKQAIPSNQNFLENFYLINNNTFKRGGVTFAPIDYEQFKIKLNNRNKKSTYNNEFSFMYKKSNSSLLNNFSIEDNINFNNTFLVKRNGEEYSFRNQLIFLINSIGLKLETKQSFLSIPINNQGAEISKLYDGIYNIEMSSYFSSPLNFNLRFEYNNNVQKFNNNKSSFSTKKIEFDLDWNFGSEFAFVLNGGVYSINNDVYNIINMSLGYEPENKNFSYSLKINNLINEDEFSIQYRDTFFSSVTTIPLVPFYTFASVKYIF
ncbi:MAG: hypothetical protein GKR88_11425 [Flavobacteriaceae bacterium]|nr:MAG: hypothetical protein GKR88_11425 [Flavobacteriaceae bacterium]